jgi:hypothetical protein
LKYHLDNACKQKKLTIEELKNAKQDLKITTQTVSFGMGSAGIIAYYNEYGSTASP